MTLSEIKSGDPLLKESVLKGLPLDIVNLLTVYAPLPSTRHLHSLVFVAQEHGLISKQYEFVFPDDEELVPLSSDLSQDIHKMVRRGVIYDDKFGYLYISRELFTEATPEIINMDKMVEPLTYLLSDQFMKFAKFTACRTLLIGEGYRYKEINERTQKRLELTTEEQLRFIKISDGLRLLASNRPR